MCPRRMCPYIVYLVFIYTSSLARTHLSLFVCVESAHLCLVMEHLSGLAMHPHYFPIPPAPVL